MTLSTTYPLVVGGGGTTLSSSFTPGASTINVVSTANLASATNYVSIIDSDYVVTLKYTGKTSTTLTGLTVIEYSSGGNSHEYASGSKVARTICKVDIDTINSNITTVNKRLQYGSTAPSNPVEGDVWIVTSS